MTVAKRLLIVDDEANMRHMLSLLLGRAGYTAQTAADGHEALQAVRQKQFDVILCDLKMPEMDGMAFLEAAGDFIAETTVIVMSAFGTVDTALEAMKRGAYDYISKPFKPDEVYLALRKAEEREGLRHENRRLKETLRRIEGDCRFGRLVAASPAMQTVFDLAEKAARYDTTVLICGESGTGKELVAQAIHQTGIRSNGPLVAVNCGSIPENLLESELFGYRKGAFTGAEHNKEGLFQRAAGGTLFLDEIGEMPASLQVKLLRVLQEGEVRPVGGLNPQKTDVRILAATARNLAQEVARGGFRQDLFYRLNVLMIELPPLRDRLADVPLLCRHFIARCNRRLGRAVQDVTPEAMAILLRHPWPGNVRELENVIERAVVLAEGAQIEVGDLPPALRGRAPAQAVADPDGFSIKAGRRRMERQLIVDALKATGGNRTQAARLLEISHPSLLSKMRLYDIDL
ncbi:MAG: sigma-54 dependent transcriptional regulator [Desulfobacteraceae bacterium]|jgi:two-component system response regulator AtoC|nr:sigma-54 dependent transcriptional regulator [Desulfobacteraceae bacterium]